MDSKFMGHLLCGKRAKEPHPKVTQPTGDYRPCHRFFKAYGRMVAGFVGWDPEGGRRTLEYTKGRYVNILGFRIASKNQGLGNRMTHSGLCGPFWGAIKDNGGDGGPRDTLSGPSPAGQCNRYMFTKDGRCQGAHPTGRETQLMNSTHPCQHLLTFPDVQIGWKQYANPYDAAISMRVSHIGKRKPADVASPVMTMYG